MMRQVASAVICTLCLNACRLGGDVSTLEPAGRSAQAISTLWWAMLAGASGIFVLVMGLLWMSFRRLPASHLQNDAEGKRWTHAWGLGFGVPVVISALVAGFLLGEALLARPSAQVRIQATASQWSWQFQVEGNPGVASVNVLHLPVGVPVEIEIRSTDVIHSLWIPALSGKLDAIPGHVNILRIQALRAGSYEGVCAEYCGIGHARHGFRVIAHDAKSWQQWLQESAAQ